MVDLEATVDRFGRVLLPKPLRDELGLEAGTVLEIRQTEDGILLRPVGPEWPLVLRDGVLVYEGRAVGEVEGALGRARTARLRKLGGRGK